MVQLHQTAGALSELPADSQLGFGEHSAVYPRVGTAGLSIGDIPFDPARHSVIDINPLSPLGASLDADHVSQVLPQRPLLINIITDYPETHEYPVLTAAKQALAEDLGQVLERSLGTTDRAFLYAVGARASADTRLHIEAQESDSVQAIVNIGDIARNGLTFVISSFNWMARYDVPAGLLESVVAVKVNHPAELAIPRNVGRLSIGGLREVNTNNTRKVTTINHQLDAYHEGIIGDLEQAGAVVAPVVVTPNSAYLYDIATVDAAIATAIRQHSNKL